MPKEKQEIKRPKVTAAVYIINGDGELFLMRSPKWNNKLVPPGGHIEYGEEAEEAAKREVKEETNLNVKNLRLLTAVDIIENKDYHRKEHFVSLEFRAELDGMGQKVKLDNKEGCDYIWARPEDFVKKDDVESITRSILEDYFIKDTACGRCEEYKSGWTRAVADYQNLRREIEQKRSEWACMSERQIIGEFIPVYDNLRKAFESEDAADIGNDKWKNWKKGIEYIMRQYWSVLESYGVKEIKTAHERFDPELHEAVGEEEGEEGIIVREVEPGYMMRGEVLKTAKVITGKNSG